jgi:hypothetical protein
MNFVFVSDEIRKTLVLMTRIDILEILANKTHHDILPKITYSNGKYPLWFLEVTATVPHGFGVKAASGYLE